jgi:endonuclease/exonuclease/phosphatase family metal-dependent hydrolase
MEGGGAVDTDEGEARVALMAEVDGPRGLFQVFCTHLSWRADWSGVRRAQVEAVCRFVASTRPRSFPAIVCGDFNAVPTSDEIRMLTGEVPVPVPGVVFRDAWATAGRGPGATISNRNPYVAASLEPDIRIDYIFVGWPKLGGAGQVLDAWVAGDVSGGSGTSNELFGSDHFAVVAELRY